MPVAVDGVHHVAPSTLEGHIPQLPDGNSAQIPRKKTRVRRVVAVKASVDTVDERAWSWTSLTTSSASRVSPIVTRDGRYFFSVSGTSVKIYSSHTGQVVSTLNEPVVRRNKGTEVHSAQHSITSAILSPHNPFQLITGSSDGYIRVWNYLDAILLQNIHIKKPVMHVAAHESMKDSVFVSVARGTKKKSSKARRDTTEDNASVLRISLRPIAVTSRATVQVSSETTFIGKTRATSGLAISPSGAWLVATGGHKAYVCPTSNLAAGFMRFVSPQKLTCLAFHPSDDYFATGDILGCIRLWYCLDANLAQTVGVQRTAQTTTMHWHAHAVSSVAFTANGAYLLSGGEEAVLVIWQVHSGKKEFVPRVGAPIVHVTLSRNTEGEEEYLLTLADSSFVFVRSGTLKVSRSIARIKIDPAISHGRPSTSSTVPLDFHAKTSTLILPSSHPSSLQVYHPSSSRLISELEISPSNRVSRKDEKPLEPPHVEHAVISNSGDWMATVDRREADESFRGEIHLKIWWWDHKSEFWILNTRIERPHSLQKVVTLAFRPRADSLDDACLVTIGEDGNIKTWGIRLVKQKSGNAELFWVARSTLRYRSWVPTHVSWSADGSLFAVSVGPHVALYNGNTNALCQVLVSSECKQTMSAHFVGASARYVAVMGDRDVLLWDLISHSMRWHYTSPSTIERLVAHPTNESFAVFEGVGLPGQPASTSRIALLRCNSPVPASVRTLPFTIRSVVSHPSLDTHSSDTASFTLVGITDGWSVVMFGDSVRLPKEFGSSARGIGDEEHHGPSRRTLFHEIFGASALVGPTDVPGVEVNIAQPWRAKEVAEIFNAPAYLMPPVATLFDTVVDSFLTLKLPDKSVNEGREQYVHQDGDVDMVDNGPLVMETQLERNVDKREMETFVDLFKHCAIKAPGTMPPPPEMHTNGIQLVNGHHKPHANGTVPATPASKSDDITQGLPKRKARKRKASASSKPVSTPPVKASTSSKPVSTLPVKASTSSKPVSTPPVKAGRKRKKSSG